MTIADDFLDSGPAKFYQGTALSGTISSSGTALTGSGTHFTTELAVGQMIYEPTKRGVRTVASITNDLSATLGVAFNTNIAAQSCYAMVDTGDTRGGIDIEWQTTTYKKDTDRLGTVGEIISDRMATLTVPFAQWTPANLNKAMADALAVVNSNGKTLYRFSKSIGLNIVQLGTPCVLVPILNGAETTDPNRIIVFHNLCPTPETLTVKFARTEQRPITAKFQAWGLTDGEIGYTGDNSIRP